MDRGHAAGVKHRLAVALTIAGSDSGGGAGIQADLRTFAALGVYGASVVTALTAQNTLGVKGVHCPAPAVVADQIEAVLEDFAVAAIKIGMLGTPETAGAVAECLRRLPSHLAGEGSGVRGSARERLGQGAPDGADPSSVAPKPVGRRASPTPYGATPSPARGGGGRAFIVYDPVMIASSGAALSGAGFVETVRHEMLPLVDCLTPNLAEAAALLGEKVARSEDDMARQGAALLKLGPRAALMKGGHLDGDEAVDLLVSAQGIRRYAAPRVASRNLHGTGCTLSSAIAADVVLGIALPDAVAAAKTFVGEAIERGRHVTLGAGVGPLIQAKLR